jgi:hypothetical protein
MTKGRRKKLSKVSDHWHRTEPIRAGRIDQNLWTVAQVLVGGMRTAA